MEQVGADVRLALRQLARGPGFALVLLSTLALGIGATTAVFSVVHGVLLRPLDFPEPDRLHAVWTRFPTQDLTRFPASWPEYRDYAEATRSFEAMAAYTFGARTLTGIDSPERLEVVLATWELFPVLGVEAAHGRVFGPDEDSPGADGVVVLGDGLWRRRFGADPEVVGRTIELDGRTVTVVGVMPASFAFPDELTDALVPLAVDRTDPPGSGDHFVRIVGRLAAGVSTEEAAAELDALVARGGGTGESLHEWTADRHPAYLVSLRDDLVGSLDRPLTILFAAVGLVLLIACANVASLLLVRGEGRRREMAVRTALGAGRSRLARQLATEVLLVAAIGGLAGLAVARLGIDALVSMAPDDLPRIGEVALRPTVLAFTAGLCLVAGAIFGSAPLVRIWRWAPGAGLRDESRGSTEAGGRMLLRRGIVVGQTALAVTLLVGAGLLVRSFQALRSEDPGFRSESVVALRTSLPANGYPEPGDVTRFYRELVDAMGSIPGVASASLVRTPPLQGSLPPNDLVFEGRTFQEGDPLPNADMQVVGPGFFETMGIPLLAGRLPGPADREDAPLVGVVNATMARTFWPRGGALGSRVHMYGQDEWVEIVGVVGDVRQVDLAQAPRGQLYLLHAQTPRTWFPVRGMTLLLLTDVTPETVVSAAREELARLDPGLPLYGIRTVREVVDRSTARQRFTMTLQLVFAVLALILASVGIYGVLAHSVARRTQEIGIRMALGAGRGTILGMVVGQGMGLVALSLALGLAGGLGAGRVLSALLYGVSPSDPITFGIVTAVLGAVALGACAVPAVRAALLSPSTALRGG